MNRSSATSHRVKWLVGGTCACLILLLAALRGGAVERSADQREQDSKEERVAVAVKGDVRIKNDAAAQEIKKGDIIGVGEVSTEPYSAVAIEWRTGDSTTATAIVAPAGTVTFGEDRAIDLVEWGAGFVVSSVEALHVAAGDARFRIAEAKVIIMYQKPKNTVMCWVRSGKVTVRFGDEQPEPSRGNEGGARGGRARRDVLRRSGRRCAEEDVRHSWLPIGAVCSA